VKGFFAVTIRPFFFFIFSMFIVFSQSNSSFCDEFTASASRWPVAQTKSIATDNALAYVFVGDGDTLNVFRKSDMERVAFLRFNSSTEGVRSMAYYSSGATRVIYAACGYSGVQVVNVTDPLNPTQTGTISYTASPYGTGAGTALVRAYDISIHGKYAYIADNTYGLRALNLNTPLAPVEAGHFNLVTGDKYYPLSADIYATGETENVYAVMILNTSSGPLIARMGVTGFGTNSLTFAPDARTLITTVMMGSISVQIKDKPDYQTDRYAYCIDSFGNDLLIFDLLHTNDKINLVFSQREERFETDNYLAFFQPRAIDIREIEGEGRYAYVTTYMPSSNGINPGLNILDLMDMKNPKPLYRYFLKGANSVMVLDDEVYVTSQRDGVYKLNVAFDDDGKVITPVDDPSPPAYVGRTTPVNAADIRIVNNEIIFLPDNRDGPTGGMTIIRVRPPSDDVEDGDINSSNIASPAFPVHETFLSTPGTAKAFCIKDTFYYGFIADGSQGIQFLNFIGGGLTGPVLVPGSNLPIAPPYEIIDVDVFGNTLVALSTDPDNELWAVDVTTGTSIDVPTDYSGKRKTYGIEGDGTARKITAYKGTEGTYAMIANGTDGLTIVNLIPDGDNPVITLPPAPEDLIQVEGIKDARSVDAESKRTDIYAYVADGEFGVKVVRLYNENNLADMAPEVVATIDTSAYGKATDVHFFDGHLYVLTDKPDKAVLLYSMADKANPQFMGYASSYGDGKAIWATQITLPCANCTSGYSYIKGVFIADGPGGISFRQVTDETSGIDDRIWSNDKMCFISSTGHDGTKTGLFPVFVFLALCLGFVFLCAMTIWTRVRAARIGRPKQPPV
jgi:hypothetical protein